MLQCVCSVIDYDHMTLKCGKNKTRWHMSRRRVCHWCFYHILTSSVIYYCVNRPRATWNLFVLYNDQKRKKTDTHTCLVPLDYVRGFVLVKAFFKSQPKCYFSSLLLPFFFVFLVYSSVRNIFERLFLLKAEYWRKHFVNQRVFLNHDTRWQLLWRFIIV